MSDANTPRDAVGRSRGNEDRFSADATGRGDIEAVLRRAADATALRLALADALRVQGEPAELQAEAMFVLGESLAASRALYGEVLADGDGAIVVDHCRGVPSMAGRHPMTGAGAFVPETLKAGRTLVVDDCREVRDLAAEQRVAHDAARIAAYVLVPLLRAGRLAAFLGVHQTTPRAWASDEVALIEEAAERTCAAVERVRTEAALRESEERFRTLVQNVRDYAIVMTDASGRVTEWTDGAQRVKGYSADEVLGRHVAMFYPPEDVAAGLPEREIAEAAREGRCECEGWRLRKGGERFRAHEIWTAVHNGAGRLTGFNKVCRDMTAQRRAEEALRAADRRKDEFLAVMSHELKNPLNLIALNAELLARQPEAQGSEALARIAQTISASVRSQAQLIDDLLDLSRMQTGKLSLHFEQVRCDEIVERIVGAVRPDARAQSISMTLRIDEGDYRLRADLVRIEQIVWNLVSNALKFTPAGGSVRIDLSASDAVVRLEVADTGRGIEPRFLPHVFEMFQQADARPTVRSRGGLGIGLALVKRLAEAHGGQVGVDSAGAGQGAVFTVVLPRRPMNSPQGGRGARASAVQGLRILLVDDDRETLKTFSAVLQAEGAAVTPAASAAEALGQAAPRRFDLIVSDIAMPGMDGYALLARLREAGLQGIPAIAVTGFARAGDRRQALAAGFDGHLGKPVDLDALRALLASLAPLAGAA